MSSPLEGVSLRDIPRILPLLSLPEQEQLLAELNTLEKLRYKSLAQTREELLIFVGIYKVSNLSAKADG